MQLRIPFYRLTIFVLALLPFTSVFADTAADQAFREGQRAFEAKRYDDALRHFLDARRAGKGGAALRYNLGVTYYRLARYPEAEAQFEYLLGNREFAPTAHYNLGLLALRQGDERSAREHFRDARDTASSPRLRQLAATALSRVQPDMVQRRGSGLFSLAAGYDSNATLVPENDLAAVGKEADTFAEVLAGYRLPVSRTLEVEGGLYARDYAEVDDFDQLGVRLGLMYRRDGKRWERGVGAHVDRIHLGGEEFMSIITGTAETTRRFDRHALRLRYRLSRIEAVEAYEQLSGWRNRLGARMRWRRGDSTLDLEYELELNYREDLAAEETFLSASPRRHEVRARYASALVHDWEATVEAHYRDSRYADPDARPGAGSGTRHDARYGGALRLGRTLFGEWQGFGHYDFTENRSNFDEFEYRRHVLMLGIERFW